MPSSEVAVDLFTDALTDTILDDLRGIGIELLAGVNVNASAVVMAALDFPASTTLGDFSR